MQEAWGYVDPGSGFVYLQNTSFFWSLLLGFLVLFLLPLRFFFRKTKKFLWIIIIVVVLIFTAIFIGGVMNNTPNGKKLIILGIDAMDLKITQKLMDEGRLPNFSYLKEQGSFAPLRTTNPSESVVAWSSFLTGLNPGGHGIFDFIMRNPKNYLPYLTFNEISSTQSNPGIEIRRKGKAFWNILSDHKIPSYIYFCPNTFPPEPLFGKMISGMGVTDISGLTGKFSFYTSRMISAQEQQDSRGRLIQVGQKKESLSTYLYGPKIKAQEEIVDSKVPLNIIIMPQNEAVQIEFQGNKFILDKNTWSDWKDVSFNVGILKKTFGIVKFYLKNIDPDLELYATAINLDPRRPFASISYPQDFSKKLAKKTGLFFTQGMPHDTWALTEGLFRENNFLEQVDMILDEKKKILNEELKIFSKGVFFFYFDTLDPVQHMFWRYTDPKSPLYEPDSPYKDTIFKYYVKMDEILGNVLKNIKQDTTLIVISDHGFNAFRRAVHLNSWLLQNKLLFLKEGNEESAELFKSVDWAKTKAYALGFGGIYINLQGREKFGIVSDTEAASLKKSIMGKLTQWRDPESGENIIKEVYDAKNIFFGPYTKDAPDLFVGFNSGFRASWQTALGGVPKALVEDNKKKWSGDHLVDPSLVPGVIFVNKSVELRESSITDITPMILNFFGIPKCNELSNRALLKNEQKDENR